MTENNVPVQEVVDFFLKRAEDLRFAGHAREGDAVRSAVNDYIAVTGHTVRSGYRLVIDGESEMMPYDQVDAILAIHASGMLPEPGIGAVTKVDEDGSETVIAGPGSVSGEVLASVEYDYETPRTVNGKTYQPDEVAAVLAGAILTAINDLVSNHEPFENGDA